MSASFSSDVLLETKIEIPLVGSRIIPRRRLTEQLKEGMKNRLTLLVAPTGYGKTTLMVEWLSSIMLPDWRVIWLTIDSFDNEPFRLWSYIATAIKRTYPRLRFDPQKALDRLEKPPMECLPALINAITQIPYHLVLVLDDYQWITNNHVHDEMGFLLNHQPKNLHLLISSRVMPPFPISRLRAQGQLVELTARDLSFTLKEAKEFFSSAMKADIDHDQAVSLLVTTEGWIAGLQLVTLSLQGQPDRKAFIARLPEVNYQIFEYLTEEVLDHQEPELRDFLLKTSLLSQLSAPLCDAMLERRDSQDMLNRIQQSNLFISPLDENHHWFGYHRLFADTLQKYLKRSHPQIIPELHRRACIWLQEHGYPDRAVSHALAYGDLEQAARIIDTCALQAVIKFDLVQLVQWISRFSDELISKRPQLGIYHALANFLLERFDMVEPKLQDLEKFLEHSRDKQIRAEDEKLIRWEIAALRTCLDFWQGDSANAPSKFTTLMQNKPESDVYFCGLMLHNLAEVYASQGNLQEAINVYSKGCQFAIDYGLLREYCYSMSELAYVRKMQGHLHAAELDYQDLIRYSLRFDLSDEFAAFARAGLAEIALDRNQTAQAEEQVHWIIENFDRVEKSPRNWIRQEWLFLRLAGYYLARQDIHNARMFHNKAMSGFRANRQVIYFISTQLIDFQVKLWQATGELSSRNLNFEEQIDFLDPSGKSKQSRQTALARYFLAQGETQKALDVLEQLIPELVNFNMIERLMEAQVLKSIAWQICGQSQEALKSLHEALVIAIPENYRRVFTDEGNQMKLLLEQYIRHPPDMSRHDHTSVIPMAKSLLSELDQKLSLPSIPVSEYLSAKDLVQPMPEPFSHRELEVLKLLAEGKPTKQIAVALMISVNTTKVHIKSIYRKTGTHTRSALLQRVIELGILKTKSN